MPKQINVTVMTYECDLNFTIKSYSLGRDLFEQICHTLGIKEVWYFGLLYTDNKGVLSWLRMNKKVRDQNLQKQYPLRFKFEVKLYPEDVETNIIQDITLRMFYIHLREMIITDDVYCPPETSLLLASYVCQEKFGDFDPEMFHPNLLDIDCLLPARVIEQHRLTHTQWEEKIVDCWIEHKDQLKEEAMLSYLKIAQDLDMYGVNYFEIFNRKGSKLWLGVDALGINVYHYDDKLAAQIGFPWSEINNISYSDKRFTIQTVSSKSPDFIFMTEKARTNKTILDLCICNHELYISRRKPDTPRIQQLKMQQIADRADKKDERARLMREREARLAAEHNQRVLEQKLLAIEQEQEISKKALLMYQSRSSELEKKISEREEHSRRLEELKFTLDQDMNELEQELNAQIEENEELREQYQNKESQASKIAEEAAQSQQTIVLLREEYESLNRKYNEEVLSKSIGSENESNEDISQETQDFVMDTIQGDRNEENRELTRDEQLLKKLRDIEKELNLEKNFDALTDVDHTYLSIVEQGEDKYKTLKKIRKGNTRKRVEDFEHMASLKHMRS